MHFGVISLKSAFSQEINGSSIDDGRHSSSTAQSPEPEDLSLRPGGGMMLGNHHHHRQMSLEGAGIGMADSPALNIAGSSSSQQQQQQQQNWSFEEQFKQVSVKCKVGEKYVLVFLMSAILNLLDKYDFYAKSVNYKFIRTF